MKLRDIQEREDEEIRSFSKSQYYEEALENSCGKSRVDCVEGCDYAKNEISSNEVRALASIYFASWHLYLNQNRVRVIQNASQFYNESAIHGMTLEQALIYLVDTRVYHKDCKRVKAILELEEIRLQLSIESNITLEFREVTYGWCRMIVVPVHTDAHGEVTECIVALQDIQKEKEKEQTYRQTLSENKVLIKRQQMEMEFARNELIEMQKEVEDTLYNVGVGLWKIEMEDGKEPRMICDKTMRLLIDAEETDTPEECYNKWFNNIDDDSVNSVLSSFELMEHYGYDENTYQWNHSKMGKIWVRCGGAPAKNYHKHGKCYKGYYLNVTETIEKDKKSKAALQAAYASVNEKNVELNHQLKIIEGLMKSYLAIYYLDCKTGTFREIGATDEIKNSVDLSSNMQEVFVNFADKNIAENSKEAYLEFTNIFTLLNRLGDKDYIALEYQNVLHGWCRSMWIPTDLKDGIPQHMIYAIQNIDKEKRERNRLIEISETDGLTGIRNRFSGQLKIETLLKERQPGMFCLIDCDKFKKINDTHGHATGDKVLKEIAKAMQKSFRDEDVMMRLGGDEFAFYIQGDLNHSLREKTVERFLTKIRAIRIKTLSDYHISVSIGAVEYDGKKRISFDQIYQLADQKLYCSKAQGGNQVTFCDYSESDLRKPK